MALPTWSAGCTRLRPCPVLVSLHQRQVSLKLKVAWRGACQTCQLLREECSAEILWGARQKFF